MGVIDRAIEKLRHNAEAAKLTLRPAGPAADAAVPEVVTPAKRIALNLVQLRATGYLPEEREERRFADYYRAIKRPIIQKAVGPDASADLRLILVSSALPGDGKTFTTLNLALSIAREHDVSVLLVDADIPKGHISQALGVQNEPGLVDALLDDTRDVESLVIGTDVRGLEVLSAGRPAGGTTELIASARMAQIAARLRARNPRRLALFDSPPLLVSSEARALVQIPGQVVLVARAGHTPCQALLEAISHVDKTKLQTIILNDAHVRGNEGYYGYSAYGSETKSEST